MITRIALRGREVSVFDSKLTAVGYGLLIPFFFVTSGMAFNLDALTSSVSALLKVPMFVGLFLVVRGVPALLLYRSELALRDRFALAVYCATELPLVVAITTLAIDAGHMRSSTAAGLVGAAIISTLIFPLLGARLRRGGDRPRDRSRPRRLPSGHPAALLKSAGQRPERLPVGGRSWPPPDGEAVSRQLQVLAEPAQVSVAVAGDHDQVLDPDAELPGQVDAGLDRDDVALRELVLGGGREPRPLVDLEAHAVAEPVAEVVAVPGLRDDLPGDGIDLLAARPRAHGLERGRLCALDELVDLAAPRRPTSPVAKVRVQSEQ